jgi:viroplasmin and RNaseH domain-containing protein
VENYVGANREAPDYMMYAVFNMAAGLKGIYYGWKEASAAFNGIKGAKAKKFQTLEEAQDWLELQQDCYDERKGRDRMKETDFYQQVQAKSERTESRELPRETKKKKPSKYQSGPPSVLLGADPSMKDGEKV